MGTRWVVDLDLEKFFDRVNHDLLHGASGRAKMGINGCSSLIRGYLQAGVMEGGLMSPRARGDAARRAVIACCPTFCWTTWTGNWKARGHRFCRYADDCNIYVQTRRAGERVMASLSSFLAVNV